MDRPIRAIARPLLCLLLTAPLLGCPRSHVLEPEGDAASAPADAGPADSGTGAPGDGGDPRADADGAGHCLDGDSRVELGARRPCHPPPPEGAEVCEPGAQRCRVGSEGARWSECEGARFCRPVTDRFVYDAAADVVLLVDQSRSMDEEHERLPGNLEEVSEAIASTDAMRLVLVAGRSGDKAVCMPPPLAGPECSETARFRHLDQRVGSHDPLGIVQRNLDAIDAALRPSARRLLAIVTDNDVADPGFHEWLRTQPRWADYVFYAIVGRRSSDCGITDYGDFYARIAEMTGGEARDVCAHDWGTLFEDLARHGPSGPRAYPLSDRPMGAIEVWVGEDEARRLAESLWDYVPHRNVVRVHAAAELASGTPLTVRYRAAL